MVRVGLNITAGGLVYMLGFSAKPTGDDSHCRKVSDRYGAFASQRCEGGTVPDAGTRVEMDLRAVYCRVIAGWGSPVVLWGLGYKLSLYHHDTHSAATTQVARLSNGPKTDGRPWPRSTAAFGAGARYWSFLEGKSRQCRLRLMPVQDRQRSF